MADGLAVVSVGGLRVLPLAEFQLTNTRALAFRPLRVVEQSRGLCSLRWMRQSGRTRDGVIVRAFLPDPWAPGNAIDSQSIASSLFAASLFPYLGFLYHLTKSKTAPPLTLFGFYFLLAFVGATIPAGIYAKGGFIDKLPLIANITLLSEIGPAKLHYGTSLSNVDWLHGGAESLLTLTNLFIVIGLRRALRDAKAESKEVEVEQEDSVPLSK